MKNTRRSIKMSVGSASSASSAGQRSGRRTNLTVADVYDIAADIGMNSFFFCKNLFFMQFFLQIILQKYGTHNFPS